MFSTNFIDTDLTDVLMYGNNSAFVCLPDKNTESTTFSKDVVVIKLSL